METLPDYLVNEVIKSRLRLCYSEHEDTKLVPGRKSVFVDIRDCVGVSGKTLVIPFYQDEDENPRIGRVYAGKWEVYKILTKTDGVTPAFALAAYSEK